MDWQALRDEFPVTRKWSFLDHAAVAPLTAACARTLHEYADDYAAHGATAVLRWIARIDDARRLAGRLLNADPLDIAFVPNTSAGGASVAEGVPWKRGDNLAVPAEEAPANQSPWLTPT